MKHSIYILKNQYLNYICYRDKIDISFIITIIHPTSLSKKEL